MALTISVALGFTPTAGVPMSVADFIALGLPVVSVTGAVGTADISDGAVTFAKLAPSLLGTPGLSTSLAFNDRVVFHDDSANAVSVMEVAVFANQLLGILSPVTAFLDYAADKIPFYSPSTSASNAMVPSVFAEQLVEQATALTATTDSDQVGVVDASESDGARFRKVTLEHLLPNKVTAGTFAVHALQLDAKGRVLAVNPASFFFDSAPSASNIPATDAYLSVAHGLTTVPSRVDVTLVCLAADRGYAIGREVEARDVLTANTGDEVSPLPLVVSRDATNVYIGRFDTDKGGYTAGGLFVPGGGASPSYGFPSTPITNASWAIRVRAWK